MKSDPEPPVKYPTEWLWDDDHDCYVRWLSEDTFEKSEFIE